MWRLWHPCTFRHPDTHTSYGTDSYAHIHLYEVELSPAESIADGGKRRYSQQEIQAKSNNSHRVERVISPGNGCVKLWRLVFFDLKGTSKHDREMFVLSFCNGAKSIQNNSRTVLINKTYFQSEWLSYLWDGTCGNLESHIISGNENDKILNLFLINKFINIYNKYTQHDFNAQCLSHCPFIQRSSWGSFLCYYN